jgi:hypothetical protein
MSTEDLAKEIEKSLKENQVPAIQSILFHDGLLVSKGRAFLEGDNCTFYPNNLAVVGLSLRPPITLKRLDTDAVLTIEHFEWQEGCIHGGGKISKSN